ncbi:hypothetical protein [Hymenobacter radiodurans]|uniref:hypothetical protein n=1 Tax=Hymenobacter radiodurans TaxID=2496028 RepID=UPI001058CBDA|nr:hypothetical protein [Hymenobacter radiodurans]
MQPSATSKFCPQKLTVGVGVGVEVVFGASACPKAKDEQNNKTRVQILFMAINMRIIRLSQKYSIQQLANYWGFDVSAKLASVEFDSFLQTVCLYIFIFIF